MAATIRISILANAARARLEIEKTSESTKKLGESTSRMGSALAGALRPLATVTAALGPLSAGAVLAIKGLTQLSQASAGLAPLAAFLPGLAASAGLLAFTLKGVGPALGEALGPVGAQFTKAQESAARFATSGIAEIGKQWAKVNMPTITSAMEDIGRVTNISLKEITKFTNSADGTKLVSDVALGTATAFNSIGPAAGRAVAALGRLASRADLIGLLTSLGLAVGGVADRIARWADSTSAADIARALDKAKSVFAAVAEKLSALKDIFSWLFENTDRLKAVSDAVSLFGIALGIATGNPIAIAIGAFGLLINNWNQVKAAFNSDAFRGFVQGFKDFATPIIAEVKPALDELWGTVKRDVLPALKEFLTAIQPIVKWLAEKLGPVVLVVFKAIVAIISGALKIISGVLNVFSGLITGRWSLVWKGVKQILAGAWQAIIALVANGARIIGRLIVAAIQGIWVFVKGIGKLIASAGAGIGNALVSAGKAVASGFLDGIKSGWRYVTDTVRYLVNQIPSAVRSLLGIASPSKVFAKIGEQTGQGLEAGLLASQTAVAKATNALISIPDGATARLSVTGPTGAAARPATPSPTVLRIESAGSSLDDLLLEVLRRSIRTRGGNVQLVLGR